MWSRNQYLAVSFLAFAADSKTSVCSGHPCRSNSTHIVWMNGKSTTGRGEKVLDIPLLGGRRVLTKGFESEKSCSYQTRAEAELECLVYLQDNLMPFDQPFQETMGFSTNYSKDDGADGLDNGMIGPTISLALDAKVLYPWTDLLTKAMFQNYVLNYANFNEARNNWRPLLVDALRLNQSDIYQNLVNSQSHNNEDELNDVDTVVSALVTFVNEVLWGRLGRDPNKPIFFKSSQTPLIFDSMSTIAFGYASCTGTSILFSNALRSVGIASRVVGTPAWYGNASQGNHNWVEVYLPGDTIGWKFLEPSPAQPEVDTLEKDPCSRWFCAPSRYPSSKVYAAKLSRFSRGYGEIDSMSLNDPVSSGYAVEPIHVPLPWEWDCKDVPGVDRTAFYTSVCGSCEE